jgi:hypothetical protein
MPYRIVPNDELHKAVAQITNSIKQDNSGLGCHKDKVDLLKSVSKPISDICNGTQRIKSS